VVVRVVAGSDGCCGGRGRWRLLWWSQWHCLWQWIIWQGKGGGQWRGRWGSQSRAVAEVAIATATAGVAAMVNAMAVMATATASWWWQLRQCQWWAEGEGNSNSTGGGDSDSRRGGRWAGWACGISPLLDSHLANIQRFLLKVHQTRFPRNSICSGNSHKIPFARELDSTPNLPGIPPCVWCTTEWHYTSTNRKSRSLVWITRSHATSNFCPLLFVARKTMLRRAHRVQTCLVSRG
jgi:hypothetical protein